MLHQDPKDEEALEGVKRLLVIGRDRIMSDAAGGNLDDASRLLGVFEAAGVDAGDLRPLASRSARHARMAGTARRGRISRRAISRLPSNCSLRRLPAAPTRPPSGAAHPRDAKKLELQLTAIATQINAAIQAGALLLPATDNARTRLAAMRSIGRNHPLTLQAEQEVQTALVQAGEQATRAAQFDLAQRDLNAAAELGSFAPLSEARRQLRRPRRGQACHGIAAAAPRPNSSQCAASPAASSAPAAVAPAAATVYRGSTDACAVGEVSLPAQANGTVIVEFTLSANGSASM